MGEAKNRFFKKAWITWAIKEESIELIHAGHFNCGDREIAKSSDIIAVESQIQELKVQKDKLLMKKNRIKDEVRQNRKATVRQAMAQMNPENMQEARASFEKEMQTQDTVTGQDFRQLGWTMPFAETLFEMFLMSRLECQLFTKSLESQMEQALTDSGIPLQLERVEIQETERIARLNALNKESVVEATSAINLNKYLVSGAEQSAA